MTSIRSFLVNVSHLLSLFREFQADLRAQRRRAVMTTFGIVWGTAAVVIMMAVGTSVRRQNLVNMRGMGDAVILLFPGSTTKPYQGFGVDRRIRLEASDVTRLRQLVPEVARISEEYARWDAVLRVGDKVRSPLVSGVNVEYGDIRNEIPQPGGRWFNARDLDERRRVVFLGNKVSDFLYGEGSDPVGESLLLNGVPFRVIGVLRAKVQNSSYNVRDEDRAFIPSRHLRGDVRRALREQHRPHHALRLGPVAGGRGEGARRAVAQVRVRPGRRGRRQHLGQRRVLRASSRSSSSASASSSSRWE